MGCCGKRRQALASSFNDLQTTLSPVDDARPNASVQVDGTAMFRYTGNSSLEVEGIFGHRAYKFSRKDQELLIAAEDVALLRGYSDLIELKRPRALDKQDDEPGASKHR